MTTTRTALLTPDATAGLKAERSWRLIGALGMVLGIASFIAVTVVQWMLQPSSPSATIVDVAHQHPGTWLLVSMPAVLGPLVWVAGIGAVTGLARGRGWVLSTIGGTLTALGLIAGVGHLALYFGVVGDLAASGIVSTSLEAVQRADDSSAIGTLLLIMFLIGFSIGPILLTFGLRRAKLVAVWVPVAAIVMVVANLVGGIPAGAVQLAAILLTFGPMVFVLLRRN